MLGLRQCVGSECATALQVTCSNQVLLRSPRSVDAARLQSSGGLGGSGYGVGPGSACASTAATFELAAARDLVSMLCVLSMLCQVAAPWT